MSGSDKKTTFVAIDETSQVWRALIHKTMYLVARTFDFQTFNQAAGSANGQTTWVPATAGVAADHLCQLLVTDGMPREILKDEPTVDWQRGIGSMQIPFAKAVWRLHATIFQPYEQWAEHVRVPAFPKAEKNTRASQMVEFLVIRVALLDLCLYFAIWTEAANVKHMPEGMWYIYWVLRHSRDFQDLVTNCSVRSDDAWILNPWIRNSPGEASFIVQLAERRTFLRNQFASLINEVRTNAVRERRQDKLSQYIRTDTMRHQDRNRDMLHCVLIENRPSPGDTDDSSGVVLGMIAEYLRAKGQMVDPVDVQILLDLLVYGDGGEFSRRIITPIFQFLAFEIDKKGGSGKEPVLRITYDDANESFVHTDNFSSVRSKLGVKNTDESYKAFTTLWELGGSREWNEKTAREWYRANVFKKTYQERRTWFAPFRANFRVIAFHILLFHVMLVLALLQETDTWENAGTALTSVIITHTFLEMVEAYGGAYISLSVPTPPAADKDAPYVSRNAWVARICCLLPCIGRYKRTPTEYESLRDSKIDNKTEWGTAKLGGAVSWIKTFGAFLVWFALWLLATAIYVLLLAAPNSIKSPVADTTLPEDERETLKHWLRGIWDYIGPIYPIVMGIHWLVTMRDGYITGAHTVSSGAAGCWTSFLKLCCGGFNNMFSNAITSSESFMFTNPSVGWLQFFINALFWFFVLAGKIAFDYFLVVKNLASPIKNLLKIGYLSSGDGDFPNSNIPYPDADFILVAALCLPALLIVIVDTGVFYQVGVFIYGCGNGLLRLRLGLITDWSDVIKEFTSAVENFHDKVLSADGKKAWMDQRHINNYYNKHLQGDHDTNLTVGLQPGQDRDAKMDPKDVLYLARWTTFADCWDQIISEMRENDLVSNAEADNLRFKKLTILKKYGMRPLVFPGIFYAGKIQAIMDRASIPMRGNVTVLLEIYSLFLVMLKEVNIISAQNVKVSELFQVTLLASTTNTYHIKIRDSLVSSIRSIINNISTLVSEGKALRKNEAYVRGADSDPVRVEAHKARDKMIEAIAKDTKNITDFAEIEIELLKAQTRKDYASKIAAVKNLRKSVLSEDRNIRASPAMMRGLAELHGGHMPQVERIVDMLKNAMNQTEQQAQPKNPEACRLLRFFMASLFNPQLKSPASLEHVMSLTTLVPHYAEDVIYALDANAVEQAVGVRPKAGEMTDLVAPTGYDISTIEYLKVVNGIEWDNFIERVLEKYYQEPGAEKYEPQEVKDINVDDFRMKIKQVGVSDGQPKWIHGRLHAYANDLMLWASQRGQLLARTTRGMLLYEKALRVMATLEIAHSTDEAELQTLLEAKFRHIVASQVYGEKKASKKAGDRWLANAVDTLMQKYPSFRVAYIDSKKLPTGEKLQYSVLLRNVHDDKTGTNTVQEVYRVRLPMQSETQRGVVLGEGKPENQNHAAIFCFGEAIQTVDMNQDNCLAEALKMRNLLREFGTDGPQNVPLAEASRRGTKGDYFTVNVADFRRRVSKEVVKRTTALVGFREYIFSNTAGSVGAFAAGAEFAFGTIVQRTMANPGGVRFHYGHPDVWNKLFTMTRGGVSKATRAFHISEDVFGGYNTVQRGARIKYREYISVGKGRDVGFEQINGFEAKVAGGNGEQAISRDVYRLGTRLDWFRLMSWYHSGIGFFMNTALLMSSIYIAVWVLFVFALVTNGTLKIEEADQTGNAIRTRSVDDTIPVFNSIQVVQIGFMSILPYFGELCLEEGLIPGIFSIARQMIAGSILFFIFRQQTSAHFFTQDVYYGGAAYVATGRGFALTHTPFVTMFSNFGRSHMYFGFQLGLMAFVLAFLDINSYALSTWGTWLVSISLFFGPFWFNPLSFTTGEVYKDYLGWKAWMKDNRDPKTGKSWYTWHTGQLAKARNTAGLQTDHWWNRFAGVMMQMFNIVIVMACFENIDDKYVVDAQTKKSKLVKKIGILAFEGIVMLIPLWLLLKNLYKEKVQKTLDRVLSVLFFGLFIAIFVLYIVYFGNTGFDGFKDIVLLSYANTTMFIILVQWLLYIFPNHKWAQDLVDAGYYAADVALGLVLFAVLFILSLIPIIDSLQATLLFNFEFVKESENSGLRRLLDKLSRPGQSDDKPSPSQAKKTS